MSQFNLIENIDIKGSFFNERHEETDHFKVKKPKTKKSKTQDNDSEILRKILFFDVEKALIAGKSILVYKTEKANGENVQIAYSSTLSK